MPGENIFEPVQGAKYTSEVTVEAPAEQGQDAGVDVVQPAATIAEPVVPAAPSAEPVASVAAPSFDDLLKEKSGGKFSKWDEVEPLLTQTKKEIEFANEQSKKVFDLITAGKIDEVVDTFNHQRILGSIDKLDDIEVLKLSFKYKDASLTDAEIAQEIKDRMEIIDAPEKPDEDDYLTAEEFSKAMKAYDKSVLAYEKEKRTAERGIKKDAKEARAYLESLKSEIVLPELPVAAPAPVVQQMDPAEVARINKQIQDSFEQAMVNLKTHSLKYAKDGIEFETGYDIPQEAKDNMLERFEKKDFAEIFAERYVKGDGSLDATKLMEELHFLENREAIRTSDITQALAKAKLDTLGNIKNIDLDKNSRESVTISDLDKQIKFAQDVLAR